MSKGIIGILLGVGVTICIYVFGWRCYVLGYRAALKDRQRKAS